MKATRLGGLGVVALALSALAVASARPIVPSLDRATVLLVYRIVGRPDAAAPSLRDNPTVEDYPIVEMGVVTAEARIHHLAALIAAEQKAARNPSACFYPGLVLGFLGPGGRSNVVICLECKNMSVPGADGLVGVSVEAAEEFAALAAEQFKAIE